MKLKLIYKIFLAIISVTILGMLPVFALELDLSVDEEIKKKYNSSKLEYEVLPNLPKITPTKTPIPSTLPTYTEEIPQITIIEPTTGIKISSGTKFQTASNQYISDKSPKGSKISFITTTPIVKRNITIPKGTKIYGTIINSHPPQRTGNGGLVVIKLDAMTLNGKTYEINGKITKANTKKIFFNNIKGKRKYLNGIAKQIDKGENFYAKTEKVSSKMSKIPIIVIISPIPKLVGAVGYTLCAVVSPFSALTTKGGNISIPTGSNFEIKLLDPTYIMKN